MWDMVIMPMTLYFWEHAKPVEFAQGLAQAAIIWQLVKRSMKEELAKIRTTITTGFAAGEARFTDHESRLKNLETK